MNPAGSRLWGALALTRRSIAVVTAMALVLSTGCGGDSEPPRGGDDPPPAGRDAGAVTRLEISASDGRGTTREATLVCDGERRSASGFAGRDPARLCRLAGRLQRLLAEEPRTDRVCTQIYGGPARAHFTGSVDRTPVDRRFSRRNGCEIADWDRAAPLIPLSAREVGVQRPRGRQ